MDNKYIYAIRDLKTGKLRSDLTSKHKKFWETEKTAKNALVNFCKHRYWNDYTAIDNFKIIKYEIVEVVDDITPNTELLKIGD